MPKYDFNKAPRIYLIFIQKKPSRGVVRKRKYKV